MQQPSVLLVEDDAFQRKAAETYLMNHDLRVIAVENGAQMRRQISRAMPDLVLLDIQLPGQDDGFALARWLRESSTRVGIIMLTAAGDSVDKVLGPRKRRRRLRRQALRAARAAGALQERAAPLGQQGDAARLERVRMGRHMLDLSKRALHDDAGNDVPVTAGEFDLLKLFAENPNRPLSRDWLLETTSHRQRDPFDRAIDLRITRIRRKIEPAPDKPTVIRTVRGVGYMFVPPAE